MKKVLEELEVGEQETRYGQLARQLGEQIRSGELKPGDRLPSYPELKTRLRISQHTWGHAYALLEREGLVRREQGRGTFVAEPQARPLKAVLGIGAMVPMPWEHPYFSRLLQGITETAERHGFEILLINDVREISAGKIDGLIGFEDSTRNQPSLRAQVALDVPFVSMLVAKEGAPAVLADDSMGARLATEHLLQLGHQRIAYLTTAGDSYSASRLTGYHEALRQAGITSDERWVRATFPLTPASFAHEGRVAMTDWLKDNWHELGCTALLTPNDEAAIGALRALREAGIRVPQQLSVIGFDNIELGEHVEPSLTSVAVPLREIGIRAVEILMDLISGGSAPPEAVVVPVELIVRQSSASPALFAAVQ